MRKIIIDNMTQVHNLNLDMCLDVCTHIIDSTMEIKKLTVTTAEM